jgi:hypothetical protein
MTINNISYLKKSNKFTYLRDCTFCDYYKNEKINDISFLCWPRNHKKCPNGFFYKELLIIEMIKFYEENKK